MPAKDNGSVPFRVQRVKSGNPRHVAGQPVVLELTEIVDRQFIEYGSPEKLKTDMTARSGDEDIELHHRGDITGIVNVGARDGVLKNSIGAARFNNVGASPN